MMWPFKLGRTAYTATKPQEIPEEPSTLEVQAAKIAEAEFPGQAHHLHTCYGLYEVTITLRAADGAWLAEIVQVRGSGAMYRVRRVPI